jgi:hypothetical protein
MDNPKIALALSMTAALVKGFSDLKNIYDEAW